MTKKKAKTTYVRKEQSITDMDKKAGIRANTSQSGVKAVMIKQLKDKGIESPGLSNKVMKRLSRRTIIFAKNAEKLTAFENELSQKAI